MWTMTTFPPIQVKQNSDHSLGRWKLINLIQCVTNFQKT